MEEHPNFARKEIDKLGVNGYDVYRLLWIKLKRALDEILGRQKTVIQWQLVCILDFQFSFS